MDKKIMGSRLGYGYIILCCVANAISFVFISHLNKSHDEMVSIFVTFGYAIVIFNLINVKRIGGLYRCVFKNARVVFNMNFFTLCNWLSTFMSLHYLDPATALCINLGVLSVTIFCISTPLHKLRANKHLGFSVLLVLLSMGLIIEQRVVGSSHLDVKNIALGSFCCTFGGITGAFIGMSSEAMGKAGFSITQILATRFYLLTFVSGVALIFIAQHAALVIDWKYYFISSLVIVFFPLLMYQGAIRELGTLIVSLVEPFSPVLTYILQVSIGDYRFNFVTITLLMLASAAIVWFLRIEQNIAQEKYFLQEEGTG